MKRFPEFEAFTLVLHYCRPLMTDYEVFDVDSGTAEQKSLLMKAIKVRGVDRGDEYSFVIAKEWVVENVDNILRALVKNG
jgi:hypothetical protein